MKVMVQSLERVAEVAKPNSWYYHIPDIGEIENDGIHHWSLCGPFYIVKTNGELLFPALLKHDDITYYPNISKTYDLLYKFINDARIRPCPAIKYEQEAIKHG